MHDYTKDSLECAGFALLCEIILACAAYCAWFIYDIVSRLVNTIKTDLATDAANGGPWK